MVVLKFGGSSVGSKEALAALVSVLKNPEYADHAGRINVKVVVVSALFGGNRLPYRCGKTGRQWPGRKACFAGSS